MANDILVIAGMHRSGTSLITHWLHDCGLQVGERLVGAGTCLLYTSPSPRDRQKSRMPSSA